MPPLQSFSNKALLLLACLFLATPFLSGCGTTRTSNTLRTATEQLLISDAIDRAVQAINFSKLAGQSVFFDERHLYEVVDDGYLISSLRQHLLASGCILKDDREQATFVVEPRAGAIGTDNDELLFGIPATNLPQMALVPGLPAAVPEVPIIKRRHQRGIAKIAVFAYRRDTGEPVWQSGITTNESSANDVWFFGAGPYKRGTIHEGTSYANRSKHLPGLGLAKTQATEVVGIGQEAVFASGLTAPTAPINPIPYLAKASRPSVVPPPPPVLGPSAQTPGPAIFPPPVE